MEQKHVLCGVRNQSGGFGPSHHTFHTVKSPPEKYPCCDFICPRYVICMLTVFVFLPIYFFQSLSLQLDPLIQNFSICNPQTGDPWLLRGLKKSIYRPRNIVNKPTSTSGEEVTFLSKPIEHTPEISFSCCLQVSCGTLH